MMLATLTILSSLLAMAPSATAHMIMSEPKPFGSPNNSPLDPSGSDYPCKMGASASSAGGPTNAFKVGENSTLSFSGSAVHGGGSCQLAVTTDKNPTKDSKFKVIHSIEGGCPGVDGPTTFSFQVPEELPNGEAVFAWTWFNKIGNREMYMNCAAITISGGKDDTKAFEDLPDMALANINTGSGASCKTSESSDFTFENPGKSVQRIGTGPFVSLCGGAASGGAAGGNGEPSPQAPAPVAPGGGSGNNGLYTPPAAPQGGAATSQVPASGAPSAPPSSAAPTSTAAPSAPSQPAALTSTLSTLVTVTAPEAGQPTATQAPASGPPAAGANACSTDGGVVCNGEQQFGICNHGKVVWQGVAAGTKCQAGKVTKRDFTHRHQRAAEKHAF